MMWDEIGEASDDIETTTEADEDWDRMVDSWLLKWAKPTLGRAFKIVDTQKHEPTS